MSTEILNPKYKKAKPPKRTYVIGGVWGSAINWLEFEDRRVVGWRNKKPCVGDRLLAEMQSGKIAMFRFVDVESKSNPPDMFFADVEDEGYYDGKYEESGETKGMFI